MLEWYSVETGSPVTVRTLSLQAVQNFYLTDTHSLTYSEKLEGCLAVHLPLEIK